MNKKEITLRQLSYRMVLAVFIPVLIVLLFCGAVFVTTFSRNQRSTLMAAALEYVKETENRMDIGMKSVQTIYYTNNAGHILEISSDEGQRFNYSSKIMGRCKQSVELQDNILCYFVSYGEDYRYTFRTGTSPFVQQNLKETLKNISDGRTAVQEWKVVESLDGRYLSCTYGKYGVYLTVMMDMPSEAEDSAVKMAYEYDGKVYGAASEQVTDFVRNTDKTVGSSNFSMFVKEQIPDLGLTVYVFPDRYSSGAGLTVYLLVALMAFAAMAGGVEGIRLIRKNLIEKVVTMQETIAKITDGDRDARMNTEIRVSELLSLAREFNTMIDQIENLKIESYERTMDQQKTMLQYLRLQLKPHFILNCMTSLYALAKQRDMEKLEDRIFTISNYFRYELQDDFSLRSLLEELQFTRNAVKIRSDSGNLQIELKEKVEPGIMNLQVPALVIETFVENSIKYAVSEGELVIQVNIALIELEDTGEAMLNIIITDNGCGYDERWLQLLNGDGADGEYDNHVGLLNLKKRLQILYADRQKLQVMNYNGAISEVLLPIVRDKKGVQYEFIDC